MKYLFVCVIALVFVACSSKEPLKEKQESVKSVELTKAIELGKAVVVPQESRFYIQNLHEKDLNDLCLEHKNYLKNYFEVWNLSAPPETLKEIMWPFKTYKAQQTYGDNFQALEQSFFDAMLERSNFDAYGSINQNAITTKYVNLRIFPTDRAVLRDPSVAGEGFPFDYVQNSSIAPNKPLFVSHYSKQKDWVFVFSSFASGWIRVSDFAFLQKKHTDVIQDAKHIFLIDEGIPIYDAKQNFLFYSRVGISLPLIDEDDTSYTVLSISSYKGTQPLFARSKIAKEHGHKGFLPFTQKNMQHILGEVSKTSYGWGGIYEQRDCSSMLRDLYLPFGVWLPRNSYQQSKVGQFISLESLSNEEKIDKIKESAIPFETLLYKQGHIVLYVGTHEDEVVIFHNTWGIKTKKDGVEGRVIIGDTLFSTLRLGEDIPHFDQNSSILNKLKSMNTPLR